jgi:transcription elongation factor GreA
LKAAKDLGDLSENSDYQEARDDQMRLEMRVSQLEEVLRNASIVEKRGAATAVRIGTTVTAKKGKDTVHYTIVGSNEADPARGLVSNESPIGKALIGKRAGESAEVLTPKGSILLEITSIE